MMEGSEFTRTTSLAPGMETVVEAYETLVVTDREGQEFAVSGRLDEKTLIFLRSFDAYMTTKNAGVAGVVLDAAWADVDKSFRDLALPVQRELPSFKRLGISVPGHRH
jgi:hypothetical protein